MHIEVVRNYKGPTLIVNITHGIRTSRVYCEADGIDSMVKTLPSSVQVFLLVQVQIIPSRRHYHPNNYHAHFAVAMPLLV